MKTATDPVTLANELRPTLLKLARHLRREVIDLGVTGGQVSLLVEVAHNPGIGISELADREGVSRPRMSKAVDRLVTMGLVERRRADDRRCVHLEATDEAKAILRSVKRRRTAWLAHRLEHLAPEELEALERAAAPLARLLEAAR